MTDTLRYTTTYTQRQLRLSEGKGKGRVLVIALLTCELVTRSALQSLKWQLIATS